jgi:hypothetical protein
MDGALEGEGEESERMNEPCCPGDYNSSSKVQSNNIVE